MRAHLTAAAVLLLGGCAHEAPRAPVPELARAIDGDADPDAVEVHLAAGPSELEIVPGARTRALSYRDLDAAGARTAAGATLPGPLIEVEVGQTLTVWLRNDLPELGTTLHFHGMRTPDRLDGNPLVSGTVDPGETVLHRFVVQDPGLYWFHPHLFADEHVELGLQGVIVVRAPEEPRDVRERILVLDDVDLRDDGSIAIEADHEDHLLGRSGSTLLVNGRPPGSLRAIAGAVERWRIVNTANGRHFTLARSDGGSFEVIAWDGPPLAERYRAAVLPLAPGERLDLLVPIGDAPFEVLTIESERGEGLGEWERAVLLSVEPEPGDAGPRVDARAFAAPVERLAVDDDTAVRRIELEVQVDEHGAEQMTINGAVWPFGPALEARHGDVEVWQIANQSGLRHPFHLHGTFFQVLSRGDRAEQPLGWRDTMAIDARETVRIAVRYDALGRWMYHCQIPEHAHMGMMGDLIVTPRSTLEATR
ncbi:MAG: multicopper oxidase family protein [Myxococcota bacterium]|nr:multicopper oxidase family protein [Myxococcota bacterium]